MFQSMNSVRPKSLGMKYEKLTPSGCKDVGTSKIRLCQKRDFIDQFQETCGNMQ